MNSLQSHQQKLDRFLSRYHLACSQVVQEKQSLQEAKSHLADIEQAQKIVQEVAETVQAWSEYTKKGFYFWFFLVEQKRDRFSRAEKR